MRGPEALPIVLCVGAVALLIGLLIGAVILRAACALCNKVTGGGEYEDRVPEPELGKAMGIVLVDGFLSTGVVFVIGLVLGGVAVGAGVGAKGEVDILARLVSLPVSFLISSAIISAMLPTAFGKAMLIQLFRLLIVFIIVVAGVAILLALMMATGFGKPF